MTPNTQPPIPDTRQLIIFHQILQERLLLPPRKSVLTPADHKNHLARLLEKVADLEQATLAAPPHNPPHIKLIQAAALLIAWSEEFGHYIPDHTPANKGQPAPTRMIALLQQVRIRFHQGLWCCYRDNHAPHEPDCIVHEIDQLLTRTNEVTP